MTDPELPRRESTLADRMDSDRPVKVLEEPVGGPIPAPPADLPDREGDDQVND